jgi:hypothetical protein
VFNWNNVCLMIYLLFCSQILFAQSNDTIRTGRPGQAIGPYVVGTGFFQIQSGLDFASSEMGSIKTKSQVSNNVLRYGLTENFEVSALANIQKDSRSGVTASDSEGLSELHLGFRYNLIDHPDGWIPGFGIQTRFRTTHTNSDYRTDHLAPILVFVTNHKLTDSVAWGHNFGVAYDGITSVPRYTFVSNISFPIVGKWGSFFEVYGDVKDDYGRLFADSGLSYLINNDLQLDSFLGWGNNRGISDVFISVGVSWRIQTRSNAPHISADI